MYRFYNLETNRGYRLVVVVGSCSIVGAVCSCDWCIRCFRAWLSFIKLSKIAMRLHPDDIAAISQQVIEGLLAASKERKAKKQPNLRSAKKPVGSGYPDWFEGLWIDYPKRKDGLSKAMTYACCNRRIKDGYTEAYLHERTRAYAAHCDSEDKTGTNYVLMGSTFFGSDLRFEDLWTVAEKKKADEPWAKIPFENEKLWPWAKEHGYSNPGPLQFPAYRKKLQSEVEKRLAA